MTARKKIEEKVMKAQQFLQVSSEIIGKHRHRSDVTRTTSTYLQICVASINNQLNAASYLLGHSEAENYRRDKHATRAYSAQKLDQGVWIVVPFKSR